MDDDPAVLKGVGRLLSSANLGCEKFTDPEEFLRYSNAHRPRLAVIDVWMPAMNGLEVQSRLGEISPATRVIIFTAKETPFVRSAAMRAGAIAFFSKPFDGDEFLAAVRTGLEL